MRKMRIAAVGGVVVLGLGCFCWSCASPPKQSYAQQLGWPADAKVAVFHIDDAGMCHGANLGAIDAMENGVATSTSVMAPCYWVAEFAAYMRENPDCDAGLHCTLNAEWGRYRWPPVAGKKHVPGLTDDEGCLWPGVQHTILHARSSEVERELRAQLARLRGMGIEPTHLDTHMGTVFWPPFLNRYIKIGIEEDIPPMIFGGHMQHIKGETRFLSGIFRAKAKKVWKAGLPVLDDLVTSPTQGKSYEDRKAFLTKLLRTQQPGLTQYIVHCTNPTEEFKKISGSGGHRHAETRLMKDPDIKRVIEEEGIILTNWRELKKRRQAVAD